MTSAGNLEETVDLKSLVVSYCELAQLVYRSMAGNTLNDYCRYT